MQGIKSHIRGFVAVLFSALTAIAAWFAYRGDWHGPAAWIAPAMQTLRSPYGVALAMPILSILIFWQLHAWDKKREIQGLKTRAEAGAGDHDEYADSAISRQSIHAAIGIGIIVALAAMDRVWSASNLSRYIVASLTLTILAVATLLSMISVMCYAQSRRWKATGKPTVQETRRELLKKASAFDEMSWYLLMAGLMWAVAIVDPALSILANWIYGFLLWRYYFRFGSPSATLLRLSISTEGLERLHTAADPAVWRGDMIALAGTQLDDFIAKHRP